MIQFANFPLTLVQGRADSIGPITWLTGAPVAPVDLTGCTATFIVALDPGQTPLISVTLASGNPQGQVILGGALGTILINLTSAATAILPVGMTGGITNIFQNSLRYQLDIIFPGSGGPWPLCLGRTTVIAPA